MSTAYRNHDLTKGRQLETRMLTGTHAEIHMGAHSAYMHMHTPAGKRTYTHLFDTHEHTQVLTGIHLLGFLSKLLVSI